MSDSCLECLGDKSKSHGHLNDDIKKAAVGHWLRSRQAGGHIPLLIWSTVEQLAKDPQFPRIQDQRENLLRLIGNRSGGPGDRIEVHEARDQFLVGTRITRAISALVERLQADGLIKCPNAYPTKDDSCLVVTLTFDGWLAFEEIARGKSSGRKAFMAMPFNKPDLDSEWYPCLQKAVSETGFTLLRVDEQPKPGLIDIVMQERIREARFLIVELTHANNGAYWEAGFATGLGKPVIYTMKKGAKERDEKAHFDVEHWLRIEWDPANTKDALERVKATIRTALPDAQLDPA